MDGVVGILITQVVVMFLYMLIGVIIYKNKMVDDQSVGSISNIVLYVATPATIFSSFICDFDINILINGIYIIGISIIIFGISILLANTVYKKFDNITKFGIIFNNVGFLGIPLVNNVLGSQSVFYMTLVVVVVNFIVWSYGVFLVSNDKEMCSIRKVLLNPTIIAMILGLAIFCFQITIPSVIQITAENIGNINGPLAMIVLGCYLAKSNIFEILSNKKTYIICSGRLLVIPIITLGMVYFLPNDLLMIKMVILIASSTPCAGILAMFAQKFGNDYSYCSGVVGLSTLISLLTMPIFLELLYLIS